MDDLYAGLMNSPKAPPTSGGATTASDDGQDEAMAALMAQVAELEEDQQLRELQAASNEVRKSAGGQPSASAQPAAASNANSVFVSNLDVRVTEADLRAIFSACGNILRVTIPRDRATQAPKGHAFIEFDSAEAATKALAKENQSLHTKPMKVVLKRENIPGYNRGGMVPPAGFAGMLAQTGGRGGRGGRGGAAAVANAQAMMLGMMQMMSTMQQGAFPQGRGRGGPYRGGAPYRGAGRGRGQ